MLSTFAILVLTMVVWFAWPRPEPQYQGMPASDYARSILSNNFFNLTLVTNRLAPMGREVAVSAMATVLAREDSPWKHRYQKILTRAPLWLRRRLAPPRFDQNLIATCVMTLGSFGPEAKPAVRTLAASLDQDSDYAKWLIADALSRIGPEARAAIPALIAAALSSGTGASQIPARTAAIRALANVDPAGERSAHALAALFDDPDAGAVAAVTDTFGNMARRSPSLVPRIHGALGHPQLQVCLVAARHLKKLGALTRADLEPFLKRLQSGEVTDRAFGAAVLMYAQSFESDVVPALLRAAPDTNAVVREAAVNSLAVFADDSAVANSHRVAAAKSVLQYGSADQTWLMMDRLPQLTPEAGGTVPLLVTALGNSNERTRGKAAEALGQLGVLARDAVPALIELRADEWRNVREAATNALKSIDPSVP